MKIEALLLRQAKQHKSSAYQEYGPRARGSDRKERLLRFVKFYTAAPFPYTGQNFPKVVIYDVAGGTVSGVDEETVGRSVGKESGGVWELG